MDYLPLAVVGKSYTNREGKLKFPIYIYNNGERTELFAERTSFTKYSSSDYENYIQ